jgi:hypothetical protein
MYSLNLDVIAEERRKDVEREIRQAHVVRAARAARENRHERLRGALYALGGRLVAWGTQLQLRAYSATTVAIAADECNEQLSGGC